MIQIVAIEPQVFGELEQHWKLFAHQFGPSRGRLICEFPKGWKRLVFDDFQSSYRSQAAFEELRKSVGEKAYVRRTKSTAAGDTWLARVLDEQSRDPFSLVVVTTASTPDTLPPLCYAHDLGEFDPPVSQSVRRSPAELAAPAAELLRYSRRVRFIDPYFDPRHKQWRLSLAEFLKLCVSDDAPKKFIEFHTMVDQKDPEPLAEWRTACDSLRPLIPGGLPLTVVRWDSSTQTREKLHDRYILTELAGLKYGWGLGVETSPSATSHTTVNRLDYREAVQLFGDFGRDGDRYTFVDAVDVNSDEENSK